MIDFTLERKEIMPTTRDINYWFEVSKKAEICDLKVAISDMHFVVEDESGERLFESMALYDVDNFLDGFITGSKYE